MLRFLLPRRKENIVRCIVVLLFTCFICFAMVKLGAVETLQDAMSMGTNSESSAKFDHDSRLEHIRNKKQFSLTDQQSKDRKSYIFSQPDRQGPGENGKGIRLEGNEKTEGEKQMKTWFMNVVASDKIDPDRSIPDTRPQECKSQLFDQQLPSASVVIIFTNEAWTPLIRTIHSVINRSPPDLLHEIVLLDDNSDREELGSKLDDYIKKWKGIVKLVRKNERQGLIRARLEGAKAATGDVIVFLDSHCEANHGWLEPLLQRIKDKRSAVLCPVIDLINDRSMAYWGAPASSVGSFWWSLHFKWTSIPGRERSRRVSSIEPIRLEPLLARIKQKRTAVLCPMIDAIDDKTMQYPDYTGAVNIGGFTWSLFFTWESVPDRLKTTSVLQPVRSPTMAGGLFAADRKYFFEVGGYDPGMDIWGGENLEISFRVWMCGGSLEFIPCSHVGHIFRAGHPYNMTTKDVHGLNSARLAEVWMDDYKRLFYNFRHDLKTADYGDISERIELRKKLNCNSFKWFLDNVIPEKFVPDENVFAFGMLRNVNSGLCLDTLQRDEKGRINIGVFSCQSGGSSAQMFSYSKNNELRREEVCADTQGKEGQPIYLSSCHGLENQKWHHSKNGQVSHIKSGKCIDVDNLTSGQDVLVRECVTDKLSQQWKFNSYLID